MLIKFFKWNRKNKRVIFCPNQITVAVSSALNERDGDEIDVTIIYWPDRCDVTNLKNIGVFCVPFTRWACAKYLFNNFLVAKIEAVLPHRKLGRTLNWFAYWCTNTSLVDDGLDTLRNQPYNVEPERFETGANFYTFKYQIELGDWLHKFTIDKVADINSLADLSKVDKISLDVKRLIIESPPLIMVQSKIGLDIDDCLLIRHSNISKRNLNIFSCQSINGKNVALEKSIQDFTGEIIVGESMVAVFAILQVEPKYKITIYLTKESINNLLPLVRLINASSFAKLILC